MADAYLAHIVNSMDANDLPPIWLTVFVGGRWLTGEMVTYRQWTSELIGKVTQHVQWDAPVGGWERPAAPSPDYVHLRACQEMTGDTPIPEDGALIRLALDAIDGWGIGELAVS